MRIQSPGFGSDSLIVIKLRWLDLVLGSHAPCHVKLRSLRESTSECHVQKSTLNFGGSIVIKEEILPRSVHTEETAMATLDEFIWKEQMERSLLYLTGETINLHQDKTESHVFKIQMCI